MVNQDNIKVIAVRPRSPSSLNIELQLGAERGWFNVAIVDRNGVFGLELPDALGLKLRNFPPDQSRKLISYVKTYISKNLATT